MNAITDTPRTDSVAKAIGSLATQWKLGDICAGDFAVAVQAELDKLGMLETELSELREWKEAAISVSPPLQEIGRELGVGLGESIHDKILPGIQWLKAKLAESEAGNARLRAALEYYEGAPWCERPGNWSNTNYAKRATDALATNAGKSAPTP